MSLFAEYFAEFYDDQTYETENGFAVFRYLGDTQVYIVHIYVIPNLRRHGMAAALADKVVSIAKEQRGCKELLGSVVPNAKHASTSMKVLLGYGMNFKCMQDGMMIFRKDI